MVKEPSGRNDGDTQDFLERCTKMAPTMFLPGIKILDFFSALSVYGHEVPAPCGSTPSLLLVVLSLGSPTRFSWSTTCARKRSSMMWTNRPHSPPWGWPAPCVLPPLPDPRRGSIIGFGKLEPGQVIPHQQDRGHQPPVSLIRQGDQVAAAVPTGQIPDASSHLRRVGVGHTGSARSMHD